jgi:hypothetical protein
MVDALMTSRGTVVFHLSKAGFPARGPMCWKGRAEPYDEHGCLIGRGVPYRYGYAIRWAGSGTARWTFDARDEFRTGGVLEQSPRRARRFELRLYERSHREPAARFTIPNPLGTTYPAWTPESLPIVKRQGRLEVSLTALTTGLPWRAVLESRPAPSQRDLARYLRFRQEDRQWDASSPRASDLLWTRAAFSILEDGKPAANWELDRVILSDATGNTVAEDAVFDFIRSSVDGTGRMWIAFPSSLCVREGAWKLRVRLSYVGPPHRSGGREFRWSLRGLRVPAPGEMTRYRTFTRFGSAKLRIVGLAAAGVTVPGWPRELSKAPAIEVAASHLSRHKGELSLRIRDERGAAIGEPARILTGDEEDLYLLGVAIPGGKARVDVTVVSVTSFIVEFRARALPP